MVDEDFVMGYILGSNDSKGVIVEKTITKNGTYHALDDNADGFDPVNVNVPKMTQEELDKLIEWIIEQIMPQLPDGTPEPVLPEIIVGDLRPTVDGYDKPFLLSKSADGKTAQVMYSVKEPYGDGMAEVYYVDTFGDGVLRNHHKALIVPGDTDHSHINADGTVSVLNTTSTGDQFTTIWGPFITDSGNTTVWSI